ncbi:hypothetical protein M1271_04085 [Patescibacteria group bacterium]|nr:hypothetical protein [Patescibacteria group bacterium]MCL5798054.1 hypothetical protein [Patescibacteria group bacterium]
MRENVKITNVRKLHLGCGEIYLPGYINIDFPQSKHTVQENAKVDLYADINKLKYKPNSIGEIRLHHVFEHFERPVACALLVSWRSWLTVGGRLRIEVPDFDRTALNVINPFTSFRTKTVALRHIFGSNEALWAVHFEGWSKNRLTEILETIGFRLVKTRKNSWKGTYNIDITAVKTESVLSVADYYRQVRDYLGNFTLDESEGEKRILMVWMQKYNRQIKLSFAK